MNGGEISGNTINNTSYHGQGGGVFNAGVFTMNGGKITGNTASSSSANYDGSGGGVYSDRTFTMNGGKISKNTAHGGGGIVLHGSSVMYGGIISGNNAYFGGGIFVQAATMTMYGGTISGNTGNNGGGVYVYVDNGIFKKLPPSGEQNSGIIYGSEAVGVDADGISLKNNSAVYVYSPRLNRNRTAGETDQIDTTTGKGLSASGNPPYGE